MELYSGTEFLARSRTKTFKPTGTLRVLYDNMWIACHQSVTDAAEMFQPSGINDVEIFVSESAAIAAFPKGTNLNRLSRQLPGSHSLPNISIGLQSMSFPIHGHARSKKILGIARL